MTRGDEAGPITEPIDRDPPSSRRRSARVGAMHPARREPNSWRLAHTPRRPVAAPVYIRLLPVRSAHDPIEDGHHVCAGGHRVERERQPVLVVDEHPVGDPPPELLSGASAIHSTQSIVRASPAFGHSRTTATQIARLKLTPVRRSPVHVVDPKERSWQQHVRIMGLAGRYFDQLDPLRVRENRVVRARRQQIRMDFAQPARTIW